MQRPPGRRGAHAQLTRGAIDFLVEQGLRRELRRAAAQAGHPAATSRIRSREKILLGEFAPGRRDRGGCGAGRRAAGLPGADRHPGLSPPVPVPPGAGASTSTQCRCAVTLTISRRRSPARWRAGGSSGAGQTLASPIVDSIAVEGNQRLSGLADHRYARASSSSSRSTIGTSSARSPRCSAPGSSTTSRCEQRSVGAASSSCVIRSRNGPCSSGGRSEGWTGCRRATVKGRVHLSEGRPLDRNAVEQSRAAIDSLYNENGLLRGEGQDAASCRRTTARSGSCSTSRRATASRSARSTWRGTRRSRTRRW